MNKHTYIITRAMVRANGNAALGWVAPHVADDWNHIALAAIKRDRLAERAACYAQDIAKGLGYCSALRAVSFLLTTTDEVFYSRRGA